MIALVFALCGLYVIGVFDLVCRIEYNKGVVPNDIFDLLVIDSICTVSFNKCFDVSAFLENV